MRALSFKNGIIVLIAAILTILSFYWLDGYDKAKMQNQDITFTDYIKIDIQKMQAAFQEIPQIIKEAIQSKDKIRVGSINKLVEALEIYDMDYGQYPQDINEIIGSYINSSIIEEKSFYYTPRFNGSGYKMGIMLDSGEIYEANN